MLYQRLPGRYDQPLEAGHHFLPLPAIAAAAEGLQIYLRRTTPLAQGNDVINFKVPTCPAIATTRPVAH